MGLRFILQLVIRLIKAGCRRDDREREMEMDEPAGLRLRDRNGKSSSSLLAACGGGNRLPSPCPLADLLPPQGYWTLGSTGCPFWLVDNVCFARVCVCVWLLYAWSISCLFTCTHPDCSLAHRWAHWLSSEWSFLFDLRGNDERTQGKLWQHKELCAGRIHTFLRFQLCER